MGKYRVIGTWMGGKNISYYKLLLTNAYKLSEKERKMGFFVIKGYSKQELKGSKEAKQNQNCQIKIIHK